MQRNSKKLFELKTRLLENVEQFPSKIEKHLKRQNYDNFSIHATWKWCWIMLFTSLNTSSNFSWSIVSSKPITISPKSHGIRAIYYQFLDRFMPSKLFFHDSPRATSGSLPHRMYWLVRSTKNFWLKRLACKPGNYLVIKKQQDSKILKDIRKYKLFNFSQKGLLRQESNLAYVDR